jgi:copper chaperone CopZ
MLVFRLADKYMQYLAQIVLIRGSGNRIISSRQFPGRSHQDYQRERRGMKSKAKIGVISGVAAILVALSITFVVAGNRLGITGEVSETTLQVSNLSCGSCLYTIESELRKYPGMVGMTADLASGLITVKHTAELAPDRLAELVTEAGYPARLAAAEAVKTPASGPGGFGCGRGCGPRGCAIPAPGQG